MLRCLLVLTAVILRVELAQGQTKPSEWRPQRLIPVWTTWGYWSSCSFTCGQGIRSRQRVCVARTEQRLVRVTDSEACRGNKVHHEICNSEECTGDQRDQRSAQCTLHDADVIDGRSYTWAPFYGGQNPCALGCIALGFNFYDNFGDVTDGTSCQNHDNQVGVCLNGDCQVIGCDGGIGSGVKLDNCLMCGGDNRACSHYKSLYKHRLKPNAELAYKHIISLPPGASNVNFTEVGLNYLALADVNGAYILNGRWKVHWPGRIQVGNTTIFYTRRRHHEEIVIPGPTHETLKFMLMMTEKHGLVSYEFHLPRNKLKDIGHPTLPTPSDNAQHDDVTDQHSADSRPRKQKKKLNVATKSSRLSVGCRKCPVVKGFLKNFCKNEFVLRVGLRDTKSTDDGLIYDVVVLKSYKTKMAAMTRLFIKVKVTDSCHCPRLKKNREYVVMATGMSHHVLNMDARSFARSFNKRVESKIKQIDVGTVCSKYAVNK